MATVDWISVSHKLPTIAAMYLVANKFTDETTAAYFNKKRKCWEFFKMDGKVIVMEITHWAHMPDAPPLVIDVE